jgi:hypothetical protein
MSRAKKATVKTTAKPKPPAVGSIDVVISLADAARLIGRSKQWVNTLVRDGWIPRNERGLYRLADVVQGYVRSLLDDKKKGTKSSAQNRLQNARAAQIEQNTARDAHLLIETDEAIGVLDEIVGGLKADLEGLAAAVTRDLDLRRDIEAKLDDIFRRAAAGLEQRASALRAHGEADAPEPEDDA